MVAALEVRARLEESEMGIPNTSNKRDLRSANERSKTNLTRDTVKAHVIKSNVDHRLNSILSNYLANATTNAFPHPSGLVDHPLRP